MKTAYILTNQAPVPCHPSPVTRHPRQAFTLIELMVVISVIAIIAAMIFPVMGAVNRAKIKSRTVSEREMLETAIERYKSKHGHYPPDNPDSPILNQLYYELSGTKLKSGLCTTVDGSSKIQAADIPKVWPKVTGFVNCQRDVATDEASGGENFFTRSLRPGQVVEVSNGPAPFKILVGIPWKTLPAVPVFATNPVPFSGNEGVNPWRYVSSNPTNNPNSYDLWIDTTVGDKVYRTCNWSKDWMKVTQ